jgi:hypothetical protein
VILLWVQEQYSLKLLSMTEELNDDLAVVLPENQRLDYWFPEKQKHDLSVILSGITNIEDKDIRDELPPDL